MYKFLKNCDRAGGAPVVLTSARVLLRLDDLDHRQEGDDDHHRHEHVDGVPHRIHLLLRLKYQNYNTMGCYVKNYFSLLQITEEIILHKL